MPETIVLMVSRHSAFYSPLIATAAAGFLAAEGLAGKYRVLGAGESGRELLRTGEVEVLQSAVGSNWGPLEAGEEELPLHFAQINIRDGFFIASRKPREEFDWRDLEGRSFVADHGGQPMLMLRYAAKRQGVEWKRVKLVDAGDVESMDKAFRDGRGDFIHQQGPAPQQLEKDGLAQVVASVGAAMPPVAFSSLCAMPTWLASEKAGAFTRAYRKAREWTRRAPAAEIAAAEKEYFPHVGDDVLAAAIDRYQRLGCWEGDLTIPEDLYEHALEVFLSGAAITRRHPYELVVAEPPA